MIKADTYIPKNAEIVAGRKWHVVDAQGQILGRLASRAAHILRGKHKATFTPHMDCGDGVIVINAEKIGVTGTKLTTKVYKRYSGYPGGLKQEPLGKLLSRRPTEVVRRAVVGMLPKNPLGRDAAKRLKIYVGPAHPHASQIKSTTTTKTT